MVLILRSFLCIYRIIKLKMFEEEVEELKTSVCEKQVFSLVVSGATGRFQKMQLHAIFKAERYCSKNDSLFQIFPKTKLRVST